MMYCSCIILILSLLYLKSYHVLSTTTVDPNIFYTHNTSPEIYNTSEMQNADSKSKSVIPLWSKVLDIIKLSCTSIGMLTNILTYITLKKNGKDFSPVINALLRHQSLLDAGVCVLAIIMLAQPPMWMTGTSALDLIICQVWHGQAVYWAIVFMSIYNLVLIAFERYLAVCVPFKHQDFSLKRLRILFILGYVWGFFVQVAPGYLQVHYDEGICKPEYYFHTTLMINIFYAFSIYSFFSLYAIPTCVFCVLYSMVIYQFKLRNRQSELGQSRLINKASDQLTKTAIVVTAFFIVALGYDLWYYVLGYTKVVVYVKNSPVQKIGVFFAVMNSVANPFIYAAFMPVYRVAVIRTLTCGQCGNTDTRKTEDTSNANKKEEGSTKTLDTVA